MPKPLSAGDVTFLSGQNSGDPVDLKDPTPIVGLFLLLSAAILTADGTGTVDTIENGIYKLLRKVTLRVGGADAQVWGNGSALGSGGQALRTVQRTWLQSLEGQGSASAISPFRQFRATL